MKTNQLIGWGLLAAVIALTLWPGNVFANASVMQAIDLIKSLEGFSSTPYWDVSRWSWGYGTAAPGQYGTISESDASAALLEHVQPDKDALAQIITRSLTNNQWAALLSFSYNEGLGAAEKLVNDINSGNDDSLEQHWKLYVYAGGEVSQTLIDRRNKEWSTWMA